MRIAIATEVFLPKIDGITKPAGPAADRAGRLPQCSAPGCISAKRAISASKRSPACETIW